MQGNPSLKYLSKNIYKDLSRNICYYVHYVLLWDFMMQNVFNNYYKKELRACWDAPRDPENLLALWVGMIRMRGSELCTEREANTRIKIFDFFWIPVALNFTNFNTCKSSNPTILNPMPLISKVSAKAHAKTSSDSLCQCFPFNYMSLFVYTSLTWSIHFYPHFSLYRSH